MISILIVDDHEIVRHGLRDILLSNVPGAEVHEAATAADALDRITATTWGLVLLDINLPDRSGLEVLTESRRLRPETPVLVLTSYPEEQFAVRAFKQGAAGYVTKLEAAEQLIVAVRRVLAGGKYVTSSLAEYLASTLGESPSQAPHELLSQREMQVLKLIAVGKSMKEIAGDLGLSEKTVSTYRTRIAEKANLRTNVEIARYALKQGLVE